MSEDEIQDGSSVTAGANLRSLHPGHYWLAESDFSTLWKTAIIAVDASVLLSLYRYSAETRDQLLEILESVASQLWVPHHAAEEFERNRIGVIRQQHSVYDLVLDAAEKATASFATTVKTVRRHPILESGPLEAMVQEFEDKVIEYIEAAKKEHPYGAKSGQSLMADELRATIGRITAGRVGGPFSARDLERLYEEGRKRYANRQPPGYEDAKDKDEPYCFGDFIFWRQAVLKATEEKRPLIIITDDDKEDWWWKEGGLTLGPRPELVVEVGEEVGQPYFQYSSANFMTRARDYLSRTVSETAIEEVAELARDRADRAVEVLACPTCGTSVEFRLGVETGSTATTPCPSCGDKFSAHRNREGAAFVGRANRTFYCPRCHAGITASRSSAAETVVTPTCLSCHARLQLDWASGQGAVLGDAATRLATDVGPKTMLCPDDATVVPILRIQDGVAKGVCDTCEALVTGRRSLGPE